MIENYRLRLMFEWGGGCIWAGDDAARDKYAVGPIEDSLPLADATRKKLADMTYGTTCRSTGNILQTRDHGMRTSTSALKR
ncbi:hypothetical protein AXG89_27550 (plasmid) [Burkholderia sp. PAMC 26561]|nr:hypothetical protein AXG89_25140 [Burkholderia sp. PAMC 26561]AME27656.1 hypothetical protein AXG89_27550 [Burkholderia sp. PAMC 26561]